ncbi:uncharacterized protein LOC9641265 [Selaginella moellendorffii]|uniref:uncharacterized protein LOC9641265 n=1 Tax=Selaginella moellendorffii TaxID=88036 RepID=UPI000D1CADB7|nr:uncharacterized protein LOC9641265 [Selaginella moellendorffii]|eukprot:XP_024523927.1 uncharacterized protein LOC9641265 [Selaginella moellendorffii]
MDSRISRKLQRVQSAGAPKSTVHFADEVSIQVPSSGPALASPPSPPSSTRTLNTSELWPDFSPHPEVEQQPSTSKPSAPELQQLSAPVKRNNSRSPEQLNLVAFRLAVLEKFATGLGKLAFVWATVVLLGGFVSNIPAKDFWTISALLLTEGTRVFSRSSELEWQQANYSLGILGFRSFLFDKSARLWEKFSGVLDHDHSEQNVSRDRLSKKPVNKDLHQGFAGRRIWCVGSAYVKFLPTRIISLFMYFLQLASATVTACFSVYRLAEHGFNAQGNNTEQALTVFYAMMLAETSLFLLERTYWEFKLRYQRLLEVVTLTCELDQDDIETMKQYWYTLYSRSLNGSVFDGLGMDLIDFTVEKLQSSIREEQLGSVKILSALVSKGDSMEETQRRIAITASGFPLSLDPWRPSLLFYPKDRRKC